MSCSENSLLSRAHSRMDRFLATPYYILDTYISLVSRVGWNRTDPIILGFFVKSILFYFYH